MPAPQFHTRPLAFACALAISLAPSLADAAVPSPPFCVFDPVIVGGSSNIPIVVGGACGPLPAGYRVIVRDINNMPIAGSSVTLDFSATNIRLHFPSLDGSTIDCPQKRVSKLTNGAGVVTFFPTFGGSEDGLNVRISADGVILGAVPARSTDTDAVGGDTGLADLVVFSNHFLNLIPAARLNFDNCPPGNQIPALSDYTIFSTQFQSGSVRPYCP